MDKKVFIIHGWSGNPEEGWFPWLKNELEKKGYRVEVPHMPNADEPNIERWVSYLKEIVIPDENTYFIGHSIGCQTIIRYLESLDINIRIAGAVFVAGFFELTGLETDQERVIAKPWLETSIDTQKVKQRLNKIFALFSDNDKFVPLSNKSYFENRLGAETLVLHDMSHFSGSDGIKDLPIVLEQILKM